MACYSESSGYLEICAVATISEAFRDASGDADLATKRDIRELELKMETRFEQIRGELTLMRWMLGILLGGVITLIIKAFFPI